MECCLSQFCLPINFFDSYDLGMEEKNLLGNECIFHWNYLFGRPMREGVLRISFVTHEPYILGLIDSSNVTIEDGKNIIECHNGL